MIGATQCFELRIFAAQNPCVNTNTHTARARGLRKQGLNHHGLVSAVLDFEISTTISGYTKRGGLTKFVFCGNARQYGEKR